jgi:hypothetical protein
MLTRLQLDNNNIEHIENLDSLVNLQWLDLSFNRITKIENLDKLTKLQDLSLFHNSISKLENLEPLVNLQVLSIGHNRLATLEEIHYLRHFKHLRCLVVKENPVCKDDNFHVSVLAHLRQLRYLDYELINQQAVKAAREEKHEELHEAEEKERQQRLDDEDAAVAAQKRAEAEEANLGGVETLFADMMKADLDILKLQPLPGYQDLIDQYKYQFIEATADFISRIMVYFRKKKEEEKLYIAAVAEIKAFYEREALDKLAAFDKRRKVAFATYVTVSLHLLLQFA